jgi:hypothetical protein
MKFVSPEAVAGLWLTALYGPAIRRFVQSPQYHRIAP